MAITIYKTTRKVESFELSDEDIKRIEEIYANVHSKPDFTFNSWEDSSWCDTKEDFIAELTSYIDSNDEVEAILNRSKKECDSDESYYGNYDDAYDDKEFGVH